MLIDNQIMIYDLAWALSEAVDLVSPTLNRHHKKVAYIAEHIAQEMRLPSIERTDILLASMLHDIGSFYTTERLKMISFELEGQELNRHAYIGYKLLSLFSPLSKAAVLVRDHHAIYNSENDQVALGSHIIHLADIIASILNDKHEIFEQVPDLLERLGKRVSTYHPDVFSAFERLAKKEYFWIEALSSSPYCDRLHKAWSLGEITELAMLRDFAQVIAHIIDFRSRFTATHSNGVAAVAKKLSTVAGFSERECELMEVAGYLHDLGKLAVPNEILEKEGSLTSTELNVILKHTYYTYAVLSKINGMEDIAVWAAYHHERPDGSGYPFYVKGGDFSKLSRIMAVADIVTALTEDRPYRLGMDQEEAMNVLQSMASRGRIDKSVAEMVSNNFASINEVRLQAQQEARKKYDAFHDQVFIAPTSHLEISPLLTCISTTSKQMVEKERALA